MALYREGKAAMAADGTVTGTGTKWQSSLSLIRPGATIMFLSSPIQIAVVNKVVSDTEIKAITTNGAVVASTDYAILLSDSLTVDGLAQDVAETLRYYQSQETVIADAVEFFKDFDFESLQNLANQIKADSEAAESSATAAATSENAAKTSEANAKSSENAAKNSEVAAENARDQVQQIINDAGEQSTLVALAQPEGSKKIGMPLGGTLYNATDWVFPEAFGIDYSNAAAGLQAAMNYAAANGKRLVATNRTFTINSPITIPTRLNADFTNSVIVAGAGITTGSAVLVDGVASVAAGQYAGTVHNFTLLRPLVSGHQDTSSNVDGISFGGASGQASDMRWYNIQVYGFRDGIRFDGPNTYLNHFLFPRIGFCWRRGVAVYASVNSNENHGFIGGSIFNVNNTSFNGVGVYVDPAASATEIYMSHTSIDYCDISAYMSLGRLNLNSCHLENNNNNPHIVLNYTAGKERPTVIATGGAMFGGPGVTSWTGIPVESSGGRPALIYAYNAGSVFVHLYGVKTGDYKANETRNTQILKVQNNNPDVIASFVCEPLIDAGNASTSSRPLRICNAINLLYITAFNLQAWTQTVSREDGTITFSTDTTVYYDADSPHSRKYVGTAGFSTGIYQELNCVAGKIFNINIFAKITALTAGSASLRCDFFDAKGNVILTDTKSISAVTSDWVQLWVYRKVPNGAVKVRIQEYFNSFTGTAYFSNENVWFH